MRDSADLLREDEARSARVSAAGRLAPAMVGKAAGVPFPFDRVDMLSANAREKLTQPYKHSVWVMRAIKKIAGPITAVDTVAVDPGSRQPIEDPKLAAWLRSPVQGLDRDDFNEAAVGWLKLKGEVFLIGDDSWLLPFPEMANGLRPLIMPRPDQMRHVVDAGSLVGWEYIDPRGRRNLLLPEQVWQKKLWNPYDQWRGLAEWEAAEIAAEGDYYAGAFSRNLMANNGDQGQFILSKNGLPTDAQRAQIIASLREKRQRAQRGEAVYTFLASGGELEVQAPKVNSVDTNFVAARLANRHEIFIAFGVPASMADVQTSYSIGSASDRYILIEDICIPTSEKIAALLEGPASKIAKRPVKIRHIWDEHSTMQAARRERIEAGQKLWQSGMPWQAINDHLKLGMEPFPGWEVPYIPVNVVPLDQSGLPVEIPETSPDFAESDNSDGDEDAIDRMQSLLERGALRKSMRPAQADEFRIFGCGCPAHKLMCVPATRARDARRVALARAHLRARLPMVKQYRSRITRELMAARVETLKRIEKHRGSIDAAAAAKKSGAPIHRAAAADLVFDKQSFGARLFAALRKQAGLALDAASAQVYDEVGKDDPYRFPAESVLEFARRRENRLSNVPDEIHGSIMEQIEEGLTDGDTTDELVDRVKTAFNGIADGRARTIATTEVGAAYGYGRHVAMGKAGVTWKQWLTSGNSNVRPAHEDAEGQTVPIDEPYNVDGEDLDYPGDDSGSPENVINCHCVSIAKAGDEEEDDDE